MPIFLEHGVNTDKFSNQGVVKDYLDLKHDVLNKTYNIEVKKLNLNVEVHSKNVFSETEKNVIRDHIHNAVNDFMEYVYCLPASSPLSKVEIYLIDNVDEYKQYCVQYGLLCDGGNGITYMGDQVTPYRIYLYKEGDSIVGLRHELSYVLQDHVTGHKLAGSVNRNLMLCVISNAIADFCEYGHSVSDQICAELRVFNKICGSGEFDKHTDRSIIDILKELKYHHCKDIEPTIRDFGFAFLNFAKKVAGGDFSTFLLSLIKRGDTSTLDKILDYLVSPINNSLFKQSVEEQLGRLEWVYKDKYKIPQNVKLQYVANDGADIDIEAGRKLHVVKYTHFGDKKTVPTVTCSALSNVIGRLCDFASFSEEKQLAVGLSGSANTSSRYYDTPPVYPMKENVSNLDKKCPDASLANSMNADLNPEKFKNDVFYHVRTIRNDDLKLNLEIHTPQDLPHKRFREIEKGLNDTIEKFKSSFGLEPNDRDTTFELYLFDNKEQYEYYGQLYNLRINGSGGKTFYGNPDLPYKIYVHKFGEILNLKHELAHALESYACGHRVYKVGGNGRIFSEGIAEYIQDDNSFILENIKNKEVVFNVLHGKYDNMDEAIRAATGDKQHLQYSIGQAFVTFLQDKYPGVISEYFRASKTGNFERARELISMDKYSDFEHWVKSKDVYLHLEDMNILKLEIGDKLLSYDNARVSEASGKHNEYYSEKICDIHGKVVGEILPVAHYSASNVMRSWNVASGDEMQVGPEYNYLKLVNAPSGKSAYVYCDKDGKEYFNDKSYIDNVFNILKKYDPKIADIGNSLDPRKHSDIDAAFAKLPNSDALLDQYLDATNTSAYKQFLLNSPLDYRIVKIHAMAYHFDAFKAEQVKKVLDDSLDISSEVKNIIMGLTYIDLSSVIGVNGFDIKSVASDPDTILHAVVLGRGDNSAISLYKDNQKIGELLTELGYCIKDINTGKVTFVFGDIMKMVSTSYTDRAYIVVLEKDGEFSTALVNGIQMAADGNVIWDNKFSHPNISHFYPGYDSFLLRHASIKSDSHSIVERKFDPKDSVITRGELLNDKGTVNVEDDAYSAVIKQDGEILHQFKSMSFYIDKPSFDSGGKYGSNFFIADEGRGLRFQFPKEITHLKLLNVNGSKKLVPCTATGDEHPDGMPPNLTDEYRYIDPIFAHRFEKQCYSTKSKSIGLMDFDEYEEGSLFKLQYYDERAHINKDEHGNKIMPDSRSYISKVDLVYDGKVIGMLSDNINQFQGDIFISASRSYSYSDFLASQYFQKVDVEELENGLYVGTYDVVSDEIANFGTDRGYSEQAVFYFKGNPSSYNTGSMNASTVSPYQNEF